MSIRLQDLMDIEGAIENAVKPLFDAANITLVTPQSDPTLQKARPRTELLVRRGSGLGRWLMIDLNDGNGSQQRQQAWRISFSFSMITDANIAIHSAYRSNTLGLIYSIANRINGETLPYHCLMPWVSDEGASPLLKNQDGYYKTEIIFSSSIAIQADAWTQVDPNLT